VDGNGQITDYTYGLFGVKEEIFKKADESLSQLSGFKSL